MKKLSLAFVLLIGQLAFFSVFAQQPLEQILKEEASRNLEKMSKEPIPAYYISYRIYETTSESANSSFGELTGSYNGKSRRLHVKVRVGSPQLDNTHEIKENNAWEYTRYEAFDLPLENNEEAIRLVLWNKTDKLYKEAVQRFLKVKANVAVKVAAEDKSPDFSAEEREQYSEKPISYASLKFNKKEYENKLKSYTSVFKENKDIVSGDAYFETQLFRYYFADTEGAAISQNDVAFRISLSATTIADDGMILPLYQSYYAQSVKDLPADKVVMNDAKEISRMLTNLKKAPVADTYTGPAILTAEATGVFFHEFFGHRLEGARMKQESDAQTFKKKIGEKVLPEDMSLYFDPSIKKYKNILLSGSYVFDDEGVRGQKVNVVEKGVLKSFLMSRTPIDSFPHSNGHGRGMIYLNPVTRQSNMIIESSRPYSNEELRAMLKEELKKQGKPYGYLFSKVSGGFTQTSRIMPNAFNVTPLIVHRIYAEDKPDELVRGVNMIGTPLSMFSQIAACGKEIDVFNGYCGAESGSVPVSCVAPAVYVKMVETQKQAKSQTQPPILARP